MIIITLFCRIMSFPGLDHAVDDCRKRTAATRLTMDSSRRAHLFAKNQVSLHLSFSFDLHHST